MRGSKWGLLLAGAGVVLTACGTSAVNHGSAASSKASQPKSGRSNSGSSKGAAGSNAAGKGVYAMGTKVNIPSTLGGVDSVTVFGYYSNVESNQPTFDQPPSGDSYGAIDAEVCAGSAGSSTGANPYDFTVLLSNGSSAQIDALVGTPTVSPLASESALGQNFQGLSPGQCTRGFVVFDIPAGTSATYVQFTGTSANFSGSSVIKWTMPAS